MSCVYVEDKYVIIENKNKCGNNKKIRLPLYEILEDTTVYIYPKFKKLWSTFLPTFLGEYAIIQCDGSEPELDLTFPTPKTGTFVSEDILNDDFVVFKRLIPTSGGPIINAEPKIVVLDVANNALDYKVEIKIGNVGTGGTLGLYFLSSIVRDMSLTVDRENRLTSFDVFPNENNEFTLTSTLYGLDQIAIHYSGIRNGAIINLEITAVEPNPLSRCLMPQCEYLKFSHNRKKYKILTVITNYIDSPPYLLSSPSNDFNILAYLILRTLKTTSLLPPLVPIHMDPINGTNKINKMNEPSASVINGIMVYWSSFSGYWGLVPNDNPNKTDQYHHSGEYYGLDFPGITGFRADLDLNIISQTELNGTNIGSFYVFLYTIEQSGIYTIHFVYPPNNGDKTCFTRIDNVLSNIPVSRISFNIFPIFRGQDNDVAVRVTRINGGTNNTVNIDYSLFLTPI